MGDFAQSTEPTPEPTADAATAVDDDADAPESTLHAPLAMDEPGEPVAAVALEPAAEAASEAAPEASSGDQIDPELYPIFEEEGVDLLAQLHAALRDWLEAPGELGRSDASMRALHTFRAVRVWPAPCAWAGVGAPARIKCRSPCCARGRPATRTSRPYGTRPMRWSTASSNWAAA